MIREGFVKEMGMKLGLKYGWEFARWKVENKKNARKLFGNKKPGWEQLGKGLMYKDNWT